MIPAPGETVNDWWETTGWQDAHRAAARAGGYPEDFDLQTYFLHDVPPEVTGDRREHQRDTPTSPSRSRAHSHAGQYAS